MEKSGQRGNFKMDRMQARLKMNSHGKHLDRNVSDSGLSALQKTQSPLRNRDELVTAPKSKTASRDSYNDSVSSEAKSQSDSLDKKTRKTYRDRLGLSNKTDWRANALKTIENKYRSHQKDNESQSSEEDTESDPSDPKQGGRFRNPLRHRLRNLRSRESPDQKLSTHSSGDSDAKKRGKSHRDVKEIFQSIPRFIDRARHRRASRSASPNSGLKRQEVTKNLQPHLSIDSASVSRGESPSGALPNSSEEIGDSVAPLRRGSSSPTSPEKLKKMSSRSTVDFWLDDDDDDDIEETKPPLQENKRSIPLVSSPQSPLDFNEEAVHEDRRDSAQHSVYRNELSFASADRIQELELKLQKLAQVVSNSNNAIRILKEELFDELGRSLARSNHQMEERWSFHAAALDRKIEEQAMAAATQTESNPQNSAGDHVFSWFILGMQTVLLPVAFVISFCRKSSRQRASKGVKKNARRPLRSRRHEY